MLGDFFMQNVLWLHPESEIAAQEIWPHEDGEYAVPETKLQIADGEKPPNYPESSPEQMVFDFYFFHIHIIVHRLRGFKHYFAWLSLA